MDRPGWKRRRNLLSYPRAQVRLIAVFGVLALAYGAVNYYVAYSTLQRVVQDVVSLRLSEALRADVEVLAREHARTLHWQMMLFTALTLVMLLLGGLLLSHRLAGPLHQLSSYLRGLTQGTVRPRVIRFRKHDFWHDLADEFNRFQRSRGILPEDPESAPGAPPRPLVRPPSDPGPSDSRA